MTRPHRHRLIWQSACIILPLLLLAGLAVWQLSHSRKLAFSQARETAERFVAQAALGLIPDMVPMRELGHRPVALPIDGPAEPGAFLYPLSPMPTAGRAPYREFLHALDGTAAGGAESAHDGQSSTLERALAVKFAREKLLELLDDYPGGYTDAGLPLAPVMWWELTRLSEFEPGAVGGLIRCAVETHPSLLTPEFLRRASEVLGRSHPLVEARYEQWRIDEHTRAALRAPSTAIGQLQSSDWVLHVTETPKLEQRYWASLAKDGVVLLDEHALRENAAAGIDEKSALLPDHLGVGLWLKGHPLAGATEIEESLAVLEQDPWRIAVAIGDRHALLASVRTQTNGFLLAIALATTTALIGLLALRRSYAHQLELGEMKSNFVASVSHELRAPVASVRLLAERLRSGRVTEDAKRDEYYGFIESETRRLGTLVENILDFSRIERGKKEYHFTETDLSALVRDTVTTMTHYAAERNVALDTEITDGETLAEADAVELRQALVNLLDNAIKFSPKDSGVSVGIDQAAGGDSVRLWVRDHGTGVPTAEREKIFERFFRSGSELTRETEGAGIGLSIVKHIAEAHGGQVEYEAPPDGGSLFSIAIPTQQPHA